jgi:hypothetical protein
LRERARRGKDHLNAESGAGVAARVSGDLALLTVQVTVGVSTRPSALDGL